MGFTLPPHCRSCPKRRKRIKRRRPQSRRRSHDEGVAPQTGRIDDDRPKRIVAVVWDPLHGGGVAEIGRVEIDPRSVVGVLQSADLLYPAKGHRLK